MNIDGLSLFPLVKELDAALTGGRIEKIYQPDKLTVVLHIRVPGKTVKLFISANPQSPTIHISSFSGENPAAPPGFCMLLRKHLEDGRIAEIAQHSLDRIVRIDLDVRDESGAITTKSLIFELMGKHSNLVFTHNGIIIDALKRVGLAVNRHRQILPGRQYVLPPGQERLNTLRIPMEEFMATLLSRQDLTLIKAIFGTATGLGPVSVKEICWRANVAPDTPVAGLEPRDIDRIQQQWSSIAASVQTGILRPTVVIDKDSRLLAMACFLLTHLAVYRTKEFSSMNAAAEWVHMTTGPKQQPSGIEALRKPVITEISKLQRKRAVLEEELAEADTAETFRIYADILMAHGHHIRVEPRHPQPENVTLPNLYDPGLQPVIIPIDPLRSGIGNAQKYYARYNKLKRAQQSIRGQLGQLEADISYLESIQVSLDAASSQKEANEIRQELISAGYIARPAKKSRPDTPSAPLTVKAGDGTIILIGRNNRQNDLLTFKIAQPHDLWFHTKDIPGSHVVLRTDSNDPSPQTVLLASRLAAYFSKARYSANVPVDHTRKRYVKKPNGAKPGFVIYDHQTTLFVTPSESEIKSLLH
ncbi:NFACT family protein [Acetonema longum]|nr:NFACT RNA binding domain-containing protein [Acetonema longum]